MRNYYGMELLELYQEKMVNKITEVKKDKIKQLEENDELLKEVRGMEETLIDDLNLLKVRFLENEKAPELIELIVPNDFFSVDLERYFKDEIDEIGEEYRKKIDEVYDKCNLIKAHLKMTSNMQEAYEVLYKFKIVKKSTGELILD